MDANIMTNGIDKLQSINQFELNDLKNNDQYALLDKIRKRSKICKSYADLAKLSRTLLNDKRQYQFINDQNDRLQLQTCLDTIQKSIKVTSIQSMIERLETITRQLGLKFFDSPQLQDSFNKNVFISCEMFYVEVLLDSSSGFVNDVKIAHSSEAISCSELTKVLRDADFVEFNEHLKGLISIYKLNADKYVFYRLISFFIF